MTIQLQPASWALLAKLDIDPATLTLTTPPYKLSAYIAVVCWLTDCIEDENASIQTQIDCFLKACYHFCGVEAWTEAWKILSTPLFASIDCTLADQLAARRLGHEQIELYSKLFGKLDPLTNARCLQGLGQGYYNIDSSFHGHRAQAYLQAALTSFIELGATAQIGWTLQTLGLIALYLLDNQQEAQTRFTQAIAIFRQIGEDRGLAHTLHNLAEILNQQGYYKEARPLYHESLAILYERLPDADVTQRAWAHLTYSVFLCGQGEFDEALQHVRQSVKIFRKLEHRSGLSWSLIRLASLLVQRQRCWLAHIVLQRLSTEYCNLEDVTYESTYVYHIAGWSGLMRQDYAQALGSFQTMLTICSKLNYLVGIADALEGAAFIVFYMHQYDLSMRLWGAVDAIRQRANIIVAPFERARNEKVLATLHSPLGEADFQLAWCTGQLMVIEEVITLVTSLIQCNELESTQ